LTLHDAMGDVSDTTSTSFGNGLQTRPARPLQEVRISRIHHANDALTQMMPWLMRFVDGGSLAPKLTLQQLRVLFAIGVSERRSGQIAAEIGVGLSGVTRIINILHRHGLVVRRRDPLNRRTLLVALTPAGRRMYKGVMFATDRRCRQLADALRPREDRAA
jgi:DNA-binding MarR family transcriptional regulator